MSLFRPSSESAKSLHDKILFWGPPGSGKTHTALTWPSPALVDVETRGGHFADRVDFAHAEPQSIEEIQDVLKELRAGALPCETFVFDSYSAVYEKLTVAHTKLTPKGDYVTDYVTVNKRIAAFREFAFGVARKNIIFIAHQAEKYNRQGNVFTKRGIDFVGDEKFRFAFDYIFRLQPNGPDPRKAPATFFVEKSASPNLAVGEQVKGLTCERFIEITRPKAKVEAKKELRDDDPVTPEIIRSIESAIEASGATAADVADITIRISKSTSDYHGTTVEQARDIYREIAHFKVPA